MSAVRPGAAGPGPLPASVQVLERGWLSSNNVVLLEGDEATVVDSGYVKHAEQTVALVRHCAGTRRVARLLNTHCHSDHIGGNAALARAFGCEVAIPAGEADNVARWDEVALDLGPLGQRGERFGFDRTLAAGDTWRMGGLDWQALAAPGHDMDSLVFHAPEARLLISADALWEDGFGVLFPELAGEPGLAHARATLDMIGRLDVDTVIPGHGAPFGEPQRALERAYGRIEAFEREPDKMLRNALRVMLSFHLMDVEQTTRANLAALLEAAPWAKAMHALYAKPVGAVVDTLLQDLARSGVARLDGDLVSFA